MNPYLLAAVFFAVSSFFSMLGMGGGILYVPILLFAGYSMHDAPGISLVVIFFASLGALTNFWRNGRVDWHLALVLIAVRLPLDIMAFVGGYFAGSISQRILRALLAGVLVVAGVLMMAGIRPSNRDLKAGQKRWYQWCREYEGHVYVMNVPLMVTISAVMGFISGMLGITGGIILIPAIVLLCGVPMDIAVGTYSGMVALTALFGIAGHSFGAGIRWDIALLLAASGLAGGLAGSRISLKMNRMLLKRVFGLVIIAISLRMMWSVLS